MEDTLQECLVAFVRALPSFRFESDVRHYAVRVALRTAIRARRRSREYDGVELEAPYQLTQK